VLNKLDEIHVEQLDPTHMFALSQVYEKLLLKMGEKGNDGGQFFTPREVIRAMVCLLLWNGPLRASGMAHRPT
jgi:type I restriction enzyme M protein